MIEPNMGTKVQGHSGGGGLADALFTTTQQRVLGALFGQPHRAFYANELIALTRGGTGAVQREIARLVRAGLVNARSIGNQKHYQANPKAPVFAELCAIAQKTFALGEPLKEALVPVATDIIAAFVYGSTAKRLDSAASDIDLMVVSDTIAYPDLYRVLEDVRPRLGRPLNVTVLTGPEFEMRRRGEDSFLTRVLTQPKIWIVGSDDDLSL